LLGADTLWCILVEQTCYPQQLRALLPQSRVGGSKIGTVLQVALALGRKRCLTMATKRRLRAYKLLEHDDPHMMAGSPANTSRYVASMLQIIASGEQLGLRRNINSGAT
jgi:hypothetical protein